MNELAGEIVTKQKDLARVYIDEWAKAAEAQVKDQVQIVHGGVVRPVNGNGKVQVNGNGTANPSPQVP